MYCQYCGQVIENPAEKRCQWCGQDVATSHRGFPWPALFLLMILVLVIGGVYLILQPITNTDIVQANGNGRVSGAGVQDASPVADGSPANTEGDLLGNTATTTQISLPDSYRLPVNFGDIGPRMLAADAIDYDRFVQTYERAGQALNETQQAILAEITQDGFVVEEELEEEDKPDFLDLDKVQLVEIWSIAPKTSCLKILG